MANDTTCTATRIGRCAGDTGTAIETAATTGPPRTTCTGLSRLSEKVTISVFRAFLRISAFIRAAARCWACSAPAKLGTRRDAGGR